MIYRLRSSDGEIFEVDKSVAAQMHKLDVPVPNVTSRTLARVIEYCRRHVGDASEEDLNAFDAEFVNVDISTLYDLMNAAEYLIIKSLLDLTVKAVADKMNEGQYNPNEMRRILLID